MQELLIARMAFVELATPDPTTAAADTELLLGRTGTSVAGGTDYGLDNVVLRLREDPASPVPARRPEGEAHGRIARFGLDDQESRRWIVGTVGSLNARCPDELERVRAEPMTEPSATDDPAAVTGIDHLVIRSRDVDATRRLYEGGLGLRVLFDREFPDWKARLCMCRVGDAVLEIAGALGGEAPVDEARADDAPHRDHLWGITWRVGDADAARERLTNAGVEVSEVRDGRRPGTRVLTVRSHTCSVPTLMIEPRD